MFQRILVAVDSGAPSSQALQTAIGLATALRAQLHLMCVVDVTSLYWGDQLATDVAAVEEAWCAEANALLAAGAASASTAGLTVNTVLREINNRHVSDAINDEATTWKADLIVAGTHGRHGVSHLVLGSVAEAIARAAPVPVLLVHETAGRSTA